MKHRLPITARILVLAGALAALALLSCGGQRSAVDGRWLISVWTEQVQVCDGELDLVGDAGTWACEGNYGAASGIVGVRWDGSLHLGLTMSGVELTGYSDGNIFEIGDGKSVVMVGRRIEMRLGKPLDLPR